MFNAQVQTRFAKTATDRRFGPIRTLRPTTLAVLAILVLGLSDCQYSRNAQGEWLYNNYCANCHMEDGSGLRGLIPPLDASDYLLRHRPQLACIIRYGQEGEIVVNGQTYNQPMAGIEELNAVEITNILNYIHRSWGNDLPYYPLDSVQWSLEQCSGPGVE